MGSLVNVWKIHLLSFSWLWWWDFQGLILYSVLKHQWLPLLRFRQSGAKTLTLMTVSYLTWGKSLKLLGFGFPFTDGMRMTREDRWRAWPCVAQSRCLYTISSSLPSAAFLFFLSLPQSPGGNLLNLSLWCYSTPFISWLMPYVHFCFNLGWRWQLQP